MNIKIIIADDHAIVRQGIRQIIMNEFNMTKIVEASSGEELLKYIKQEDFDLVISDISMPGISGIEALRIIHLEYPLLPVLILSMHADEEYAIISIKEGASGYLSKSSATEELVKAIKVIMSGKKYISASLSELLADNLTKGTISLPHESLAKREFEVFRLIASGKNLTEISGLLFISVQTVSTYRSRILEKMKLHSNADIIHYAISHKLI